MNRCRICDVVYDPSFPLRFFEEGCCPVCEGIISKCLEELEDFEETQTYGCEEVEDDDYCG